MLSLLSSVREDIPALHSLILDFRKDIMACEIATRKFSIDSVPIVKTLAHTISPSRPSVKGSLDHQLKAY